MGSSDTSRPGALRPSRNLLYLSDRQGRWERRGSRGRVASGDTPGQGLPATRLRGTGALGGGIGPVTAQARSRSRQERSRGKRLLPEPSHGRSSRRAQHQQRLCTGCRPYDDGSRGPPAPQAPPETLPASQQRAAPRRRSRNLPLDAF